MTILICAHAFAGVYFIYIYTEPLLTYPRKREEDIESLKQLRDLINGCSDDLTQIFMTGSVEYLEGEENMFEMYSLVIKVWFWLIVLCAYGLWNGIIRHILFLREQE